MPPISVNISKSCEQNLDNPQELTDEQIDAIAGGYILYRDVDGERQYRIIDREGKYLGLTKYLDTARRVA